MGNVRERNPDEMERQPNPGEQATTTPNERTECLQPKHPMWCRARMRQKSKTLPSDIVQTGRNPSAGLPDFSKDSLMGPRVFYGILSHSFYTFAGEATTENVNIFPRHRNLQLQLQEVLADLRGENCELCGSWLCIRLISAVLWAPQN